MKKNININLFGTLYAIDEDACKLLENYLDNMRSYFARRDGGDEIVDDIEHRVAEHLWNLKEQGLTAVDIATVKGVIESIGNPTQVDGGDAEADGSTGGDTGDEAVADGATAGGDSYADGECDGGRWIDRVIRHVGNHRFYRDGKDKIAGGVMSGLCHYCGGGDVLVWRVGTVLLVMALFFVNQITRRMPLHSLTGVALFLPVVLYVSLWLLAPVARTAGERLCMRGDEVTPESLGRAVIAEAGEEDAPKGVRRRTGIVGRMVEIVLFGVKSAAAAAFAVLSAFSVAYLVCGIIYAVVGEPFLVMFNCDKYLLKALESIPMLGLYWVVSAVCCLAASLLPLLGLLRTFRQEKKPLGMAAVATCVVAWLVAVVVGILLFVLFGIHMERESDANYRLRNTRNGIYLNEHTWEWLDRSGWQVSAVKNISDGLLYDYYECDPLHLGSTPLCLRPEESGVPVELAMSHRENAEAGDYVLECMADCSLTDATLSVWSGGKCLALLRLDGYGASANRPLKGTSWHDSRTLPLFSSQNDSTVWVDKVQGEKYDADGNWRYLASPRFSHEGGMLEYRLRIGQRDVPEGNSICGRMWLDHVGVRKQ